METNTRNIVYTASVIEDPENPENVIITFPDEMMVNLGWCEGDTLEWEVEGNSVILRKIGKTSS